MSCPYSHSFVLELPIPGARWCPVLVLLSVFQTHYNVPGMELILGSAAVT